MSFIGSFADKFCNAFKEGSFLNLHLKEDISTIYHSEYNSGVGSDTHYWCVPPSGFTVNCDRIIGLFGTLYGVALAVKNTLNDPKYSIILKNPNDIPDALVKLGLQVGVEYLEHEIADLIKEFLPDFN